MKRCLLISVLLGFVTLTVGCYKDQSIVNSKPATPASNDSVASPKKEIIAQNVLAAQLARHDQFEARNSFAPNEPISASLFLASAYLIAEHLSFCIL